VELSRWEIDSFSDGEKTPQIIRNPKIYYRIHKCPARVLILSQMNPVHTPYPIS
jgi:hypothetical protein